MLHVYTCYYLIVNHQNLTLKLPSDLIQRAKISAAQKGTSISAMLAARLEELVGEDAAYQAARVRALRRLDRALPMTGQPYTRRSRA